MFINRSGSMVLLFTSLYMVKDLKYSIETAGIVMSFYGIGSVLGSYAGGWLTDRFEHFFIMFWSLTISGAILFLLPLVEHPAFVSVILFFYALVGDAFRPANSAAIATFSTAENRTRSVSLVRLAVNLGFSVGPAMGGFIALYFGYHALFVLDGLTSFGAALLLWIYLPKKAKDIATQRKNSIEETSTSAYSDVTYLFFIGLVALYATCFFQLFASIPQYFSQVCGYSEDTIGLLLALNGFIVVVVEMPLVARLEQNNASFTYITWGVLCIPLAFGLLIIGQGAMVIAVTYTLIITLSEILAMPFMMNFALSRPARNRQGQYSALYSISYGIANIAAPPLGLAIAGTYGFTSMLLFFITLSGFVAFGFAWLKLRV